jgi:sirohydrochlorin cobaltochelatase
MKQTILLVGHGSREPEGNLEIEQFAEEWRAKQPQRQIDVCFIEFADVLLDDGLDNSAKHSEQVIVVPLILNAAGHVKMDIPEAIEHARLRHPAVEFIYCRHIGSCEEILTLLKRNLRQSMMTLDMPDPRNTGVILLGRGSSDKVANGEVAKMARWLYEEGEHPLVDIAFTGITHPRLESVVQRQTKLEMRQIVILPFYLFTGTLIKRITRQVERLQSQYPQIQFALANYIGFEDEIYQLVEQRISEACDTVKPALMECDGCKYREFAADHGHGHHHHDHTVSA